MLRKIPRDSILKLMRTWLIGGRLLVYGWSCNWFNSCCGGSDCCRSGGSSDKSANTTVSDKSKSSKSSEESTFELDVSRDTYYGDNYQLDTQNQTKVFWIIRGKKCSKVKCGDKDVWTYKEGEYPIRVRYFGGKNKIYVEFSQDKSKTYIKDNENWKEETQDSTQKSGTDGSGGGTTPASPTSGGGSTGTGGSTKQVTPATQ